MNQDTQPLTQVEFSPDDHDIAAKVARALGYDQSAYTSTSSLWGLFCLAENPDRATAEQPTHDACIIKTRELGFLVVQLLEDLGIDDNGIVRSQRRLRGVR